MITFDRENIDISFYGNYKFMTDSLSATVNFLINKMVKNLDLRSIQTEIPSWCYNGEHIKAEFQGQWIAKDVPSGVIRRKR